VTVYNSANGMVTSPFIGCGKLRVEPVACGALPSGPAAPRRIPGSRFRVSVSFRFEYVLPEQRTRWHQHQPYRQRSCRRYNNSNSCGQ